MCFQVDDAGRLTDQQAEPIAADLRPEADGKENAKLKLIAGLLGVPFNDLRQRELIAARRRALIWRGIAATLLVLAVLATAGGWLAWRYAQYAEGLLGQAIKISADQVSGAVNVADQQGVSRKAIEELLARAESAFNGLYRRIAEAPALPWRQSTVPLRLRGQNAVRLLALADLYGKLGNIERQLEMAEEARTELTSVVAEEPSDLYWRGQLALSHDLIAGAFARQWQVADALERYRTALAIREELAASDPGNVRWQREIALSHASIGDLLRRQGDWAAALEAFETALALEERLAAAAPADLERQRDLIMIRQRVGDMLLKQDEYEGRDQLSCWARRCRAAGRGGAYECAAAVGPFGQPGETGRRSGAAGPARAGSCPVPGFACHHRAACGRGPRQRARPAAGRLQDV